MYHLQMLKVNPEMFPKPQTVNGPAALAQEQQLTLLLHWCNAMKGLNQGNLAAVKKLSREFDVIKKIGEELTREYASRVAKQTAAIVTITEGKVKNKTNK